jgi:hypothetical protein
MPTSLPGPGDAISQRPVTRFGGKLRRMKTLLADGTMADLGSVFSGDNRGHDQRATMEPLLPLPVRLRRWSLRRGHRSLRPTTRRDD